MKINKNSWHYALYRWTFAAWGTQWKLNPECERHNLCRYVQRLLWLMPLTVLMYAFCTLFSLVMTPIWLTFGFRPTNIYTKTLFGGRRMTGYPGLKVKIAGESFRLHPWVIVVPSLLIYGEYAWWHYCSLAAPLTAHILVAVVIFGVMFVEWMDVSDTPSVANEWFKAKKQGVCPLIEFVDDK